MLEQIRTRLAVFSQVTRLFGACRGESPRALDHEIDEELTFHLDSLAEKYTAEGLSPAEALRQAHEQFGSLPYYTDACRRIDLGDEIMASRLIIASVACLSLLVLWLTFEVRSLQKAQSNATIDAARQRAAIAGAQSQADTKSIAPVHAAAAAEKDDLSGRVVDKDGRPLESARLLIILKTWPGGRYRQQAFDTVTNRDGEFRMPKLVPANGQFAVQIAAVKAGYALESIL